MFVSNFIKFSFWGETIYAPSIVGYKEQLLIGPAMIDAYKGEHNAAPMGIYICESAFQRLRGIPQNWKWL